MTIEAYGQDIEAFTENLKANTSVKSAVWKDSEGKIITSGKITEGQTLTVQIGRNEETFSVIKGTAYAAEDILAEGTANPDTTDWFPYVHPGITSGSFEIMGSVLDVSSILGTEEAGLHGYVKADGGSFVFEDGTPARFWGVNVVGSACFPSEEFAPILADSIAASGFNLVRFHSMDNPGKLPNIFGSESTSGPSLSRTQMQKLCYFIKQLKDRGIYYNMNQTNYRQVYAADGVPSTGVSNGLKGPAYYDADIIAIQNEYSRMLMNFKNPYTGYTIGSDPALAMVELNNETSLVGAAELNIDNNGRYYTELKRQFSEWLKKKYSSEEELAAAWAQTGKKGLASGETISDSSVEVVGRKSIGSCSTQRRTDTTGFLTEVQEKYFEGRIDYLRSLGVQCPITGCTAWEPEAYANEVSMVYSNRNTDFIDSHHYLSHPSGGWELKYPVRCDAPWSMLDNEYLGFIAKIAGKSLYGKPRVISEWNVSDPMPSISEGMLLMSAVSSMQGWYPILFQYTETDKLISDRYANNEVCIEDFFSMECHPARKAMAAAAAIIYRRGDVTEADRGYYFDYSGRVHSILNTPRPGEYLMTGKTGIVLENPESIPEEYKDEAVKAQAEADWNGDRIYNSVTGELTFNLASGNNDNDRAFVVNTDKTQAVTGTKEGYASSAVLKDIDITIENKYATVVVNSLDDKPICESGSMLLTTVGQVWNSGQVLRRDGTKFLKGGTYPTLCEPIVGEAVIKTAFDYDVYILDSNGHRCGRAPTYKNSSGHTVIRLLKENQTMNYEIAAKARLD